MPPSPKAVGPGPSRPSIRSSRLVERRQASDVQPRRDGFPDHPSLWPEPSRVCSQPGLLCWLWNSETSPLFAALASPVERHSKRLARLGMAAPL